MEQDVLQKLKRRKRKRLWTRLVSMMMCVVVFCTTYALILPAITKEADTFCGMEAHVHTSDCYPQPGDLICEFAQTEIHVHTESCHPVTQTLPACGLEEVEAHTHTESCMPPENKTLCCALEEKEGHTHSEACEPQVTQTLSCTKPENEEHTHTGECYINTTSYGCGLEEAEAHTHGDACYTVAETCTLTETEGHTHSEACYPTVYDCGLEEQQHVHTEACYAPALICTPEENDDHTHTAACYTGSPICGLEEHTHTLACYSDPEADVESAAVWEATFAHVTLTGDRAADVVAIAQTQIGYTESTHNYEVWGDNSTHGYTRYGAWYGMPYAEWGGMFAAFCLRYAGVDSTPIHHDVRHWIEELASHELYCGAGETQPQKGSLIFFDREGDGLADHVGIVTEIQEAQEHTGASITVLEGNASDCVKQVSYQPTDPAILGYGLLPGQERIPVTVEEPEEEDHRINTDLDLGPVVIITAEESVLKEITPEKGSEAALTATSGTPRATTDLKEYLGRKDVNGSFFLSLTDDDDKPLPEDENGNFIAEPGKPYELTLTVDSPKGFAPGSYTYQLPAGLDVQVGSGDLVAKGTYLGTWTITENGLITLVFNKTANNYTNAILSAQMGIYFQESDTIIQFDGDIRVVIKKPPEEEEEENDIEMAKWGGSDDGTTLNWQVRVIGHEGAQIAGTLVTDRITSGNHYYTDQNRANTIHANATINNVWHDWIITADDPNLIYWTDTGWQYKMPATVKCNNCGKVITLADNGVYDFYYTSTPEATDTSGTEYYVNYAEFGKHGTEGVAVIKYGTGPMGLEKDGYFQSDAEGGKFVWTVNIQIPGMSAGRKAIYKWFVQDGMNVRDANGNEPDGEKVHKPHNDMDLSVTTITRNGVTTTLNRMENATATDEIVWDSSEGGWNGEWQVITFYCRCHCTEANCPVWSNGKCGENHVNGFCLCWTVPDDVEMHFTYQTDASTIMEYYGENAKVITNYAELYHGNDYSWEAGNGDEVEVPSIFEKDLTDPFTSNDPNHPERKYIASYTITLNEAKQDLSPNGTPITIIDEMTDSLVYVAGSMIITAEDVYGNTQVLTEGTDYTLVYDGSDRPDNLHVLTIELKHPQPAMYTLKYDTSIHIKGDLTEALPYQNWARVTIRGKNMTADTEQRLYTDINFVAKSYRVDVVKTADGTDIRLPGATFGLYSETGGLIARQTTDENGELTFITSITDGIILLEHEPYYIQEIEAPEGFLLDTTKYWFYFCDQGEGCTEGSYIKEQHQNAVRIPGSQVHTFNMTNTMIGYELPETGGSGTHMYTTAGLLLMLTSAAYLMYRHKARRREDF